MICPYLALSLLHLPHNYDLCFEWKLNVDFFVCYVLTAMAIADEPEYMVPSFSSKPAEIKQGPPDVLSLEDIAWADSCLVKDPDISQIDWNSWNSFGHALNDSLSSETEALVPMKENHPEGFLTDVTPSSQQMGSTQILGTRASVKRWEVIDVESSITELADENSEDQLGSEQTDFFQSAMNLENEFLPASNENLEKLGIHKTEEEGFPGFVMEEQSVGDIFKVWDLGFPAEEGEFIDQLNKALYRSSLQPSSPSVSDDALLKGLNDITIDDIISGISDLSLNHLSE